ncbi:NB-ARC domain-containing protein [Streptomyces griseoaurantiacus]|uniref:NB-ARC domain-containing protein n=1 Tax=Streptomyces griseoaurantiacus TaxID=68213 RepID=UPI0037916361
MAVVMAQWRLDRPEAEAGDPPLPPPPAVPGWVIDRAEADQAIAAVCSRQDRAVGITAALEGAGGFGKTTLAEVVCANRRVRRHFRGRVYVVSVGRDVRGRAAIAAKVGEATRFITGDTSVFDDPDLAGAHLGRLLDQRPRTLLVLDDIWESEQLEPFLKGGSACVRLVTTRIAAVLPVGANRVLVDEMSLAQARQLLRWELPPLPETAVQGLLVATGRWPLLLRLTNRLMAADIATGADAAGAAADILLRLRDHGPAAVDDPSLVLDLDDPKQRKKAVRATVEAATRLLPPSGGDRFAELGVFAEDEAIPISLVARLWQATGGLTLGQSRDLCRALGGLSLLKVDSVAGGHLTIHDVIRDYLRSESGPDGLAVAHAALVDAVEADLPPASQLTPSASGPGAAWWELTDGYMLDHAISHLLAAGRPALAEAVAGDIRWVETRMNQRGPLAAWRDLTQIPTPDAEARARDLAGAAHLLGPTQPAHALAAILRSRLEPIDRWHDQVVVQQGVSHRPALTNRWTLPDLPNSALLRTLVGHTSGVRAVAISPDGTWLATAGRDGDVRIWDRTTGFTIATLTGHTAWVNAVAISPDGTWLATGSDDGEVRIWDRATEATTAILAGHVSGVTTVAISPDGTWLATAGYDKETRIWNRAARTVTATLRGHIREVRSVAISPDGTWLATGSAHGEVRIWDRAAEATTATLTGPDEMVRSVAISPDGTWLATGSDDGEVRIWDKTTGVTTLALAGQSGPVAAVAIAPEGDYIAAGTYGGEVRIWDKATGTTIAIPTGHTDIVSAVAIAPDGTWLATAGNEDVRIWDRAASTAAAPLTAAGWSRRVSAVAIPPDGTWLATADYKDLRIRDRAAGTTIATLTAAGRSLPMTAVAIASDGTWLVTGDEAGEVRIWDRSTGTVTASVVVDGPHSVTAVAIAPDGTWFASISSHGAVQVWDRATNADTIAGYTSSSVYAAAISPDGAWLATGSDTEVLIWDMATCLTTAALAGHNHTVCGVAIAPDGTWLATGDEAGEIRLWDRSTGATVTVLTGHANKVYAVAIAPNGNWIATADSGGEIRIWDRVSLRIATLMRADGALFACAWTPDGHSLAAGGGHGVYLYDFCPGTGSS